MEELEPLAAALPLLDLEGFSFVSIHAPSRFAPEQEAWVVDQLYRLAARNYPIIVHPDVLFTPARWVALGENLVVENMDKRKPIGRTARELETVFQQLPAAQFCLDIGHARQIDPSMQEAYRLLEAFGDRLAQVHISEVNAASYHDPLSLDAIKAFQPFAAHIPEETPIILESAIDKGQSDIITEVGRAREALRVGTLAPLETHPS